MVLLVLALLWGVVLIPPALRNRAEARQGRSVENFRKRLEVLAPPEVPRATRPSSAVRPAGSAPPRASFVAEPGPLVTPARKRPAAAAAAVSAAASVFPHSPSRPDVLRRRRQVFTTLCLAVSLTAGLALALPGLRPPLVAVHLLAVAGLAAYVSGLRRLRHLAMERQAKVRYLPVAVAIPVTVPDSGAEAEALAVRSAAL